MEENKEKIRIISSIAQGARFQWIELVRSSRKLSRTTGLPRTLLGLTFAMLSQTWKHIISQAAVCETALLRAVFPLHLDIIDRLIPQERMSQRITIVDTASHTY